MFLHLGGNTIVHTKDVIAILNAENRAEEQWAVHSVRYALGERQVKRIGEDAKAVVVTTDAVYISPISSNTLRKRAEFLADLGE
ncbi:MAG: extracellular matrix regulator RemB [Bacteroidota bacterium]